MLVAQQRPLQTYIDAVEEEVLVVLELMELILVMVVLDYHRL
jgi:hypothetical protein